MTRAPFDPAPVIADTLDLLAHHGPELRRAYWRDVHQEADAERVLSLCGSCLGSGRQRLPEHRGTVVCWACRGRGAR